MDLELMHRTVEKKGKFFISNEEINSMKMDSTDTSYSELLGFMQANDLELVEKNSVMSLIKKKD